MQELSPTQGQSQLFVLSLQVDGFLPSYLADMVSAYANMVHHPGPLIDQMTQRMLPNLHIMEAGDAPLCRHVIASVCTRTVNLLIAEADG